MYLSLTHCLCVNPQVPFSCSQLSNNSLSAMEIPLRTLSSSLLAKGEQRDISLPTSLSVTSGQERERGGEKPQSHVRSLLFSHHLGEGERELVIALLFDGVLGQRLRVRRNVAGSVEMTWSVGQTFLLYRLLYGDDGSFG